MDALQKLLFRRAAVRGETVSLHEEFDRAVEHQHLPVAVRRLAGEVTASALLAAAALASVLAAVVVVPAFAAALPGRVKPCVRPSNSRQSLLAPAVLYVALAACAVAAWGIGKGLPGEFIPAEDIGEIVVDCKMAEGTSMPVTADVMRNIYRKVRGIEGIEKSTTLLGESIVSGYGENNAKMYLVLKDWAKRGKSMFEIAREVEKAVADVPEAMVFTICPPPMQGQGNQGGLTVLVQSMEDADPVRFANEMQKFRAALRNFSYLKP